MGKNVKRALSLGVVVALALQSLCVSATDDDVEILTVDEYIQSLDETDFSSGEDEKSFLDNEINVTDDFLIDETLNENNNESDIEVIDSNMTSDEEFLISTEDEYILNLDETDFSIDCEAANCQRS
jgi:hypothetical protein